MKIKPFQPTLSLHPTQFSVGMLEVECKVTELRKLGSGKLRKAIDDTPIPVVISPWKQLCLVDHHHFLFACWHADVKKVRVKVVGDYSKSRLSYIKFWRRMVKNDHAYLRDQFGDGPRPAFYLPLDVRGMSDDPYRSLAWMVRQEGGYDNSTESFAEFQWADFFRSKNLLFRHGREGFHGAVLRGIKLARSGAAKKLPGFHTGKTKPPAIDEASLLKKSKYIPKARSKGELASLPKLKKA